MSGRFVIEETPEGWWFRLFSGDGELLGSSGFYTRRESVVRAVESVRKFAGDAVVVDLTEEVVR